MRPINSYLISAWYDWMVDNGYSPHLVVSTKFQGVFVPQAYVKDDQIVLCIDQEAVDNLKIDHDQVSFLASFQGIAQTCRFPICAVRAIYDLDSGQGTVLPELEQMESSAKGAGFMRVIK
jgi:stringent starvation protein B